MRLIGGLIADVINEVKGEELPEDKDKRNEVLKGFKERIKDNDKITEVRRKVIELCDKFPLYPGMELADQ